MERYVFVLKTVLKITKLFDVELNEYYKRTKHHLRRLLIIFP